jgi:hypothetical protein
LAIFIVLQNDHLSNPASLPRFSILLLFSPCYDNRDRTSLARSAGALFRRLPTSVRPLGESACERHKLLLGLDLKFLRDPLALRGDAFLSATEFLCNLPVCFPACE